MNLFAALRTRIQRNAASRTARDAYFAAENNIGKLHDRLGQVPDPRERAKTLRQMADHELRMARLHHRAFGADATDDGIDLADTHLYVSMLYRVLGDVEHVVATNGRVGRNYRFHELGEAADEVLDRMVATPDLTGRTALLEDLHGAVHHRAGGQAAEALWCLPSPGHSGWLTVAEKDNWLYERSLGPSHATMQRMRRLFGRA